jgi:hypothetical protein
MERDARVRQWCGLYLDFPLLVKQIGWLKSFRFVLLKPLGGPDLDERLPRNSRPFRIPVKGINHPRGKINIHPSLFLSRALGLRHIEELGNILSLVKFPVKLLRFHKSQPLHPGTGGRRSLSQILSFSVRRFLRFILQPVFFFPGGAKIPPAVNERQNGNPLILNPIDETIAIHKQLSDILIPEFRHHAPPLC